MAKALNADACCVVDVVFDEVCLCVGVRERVCVVKCVDVVVGENITVQRENNKPLKTPMGDKAGV